MNNPIPPTTRGASGSSGRSDFKRRSIRLLMLALLALATTAGATSQGGAAPTQGAWPAPRTIQVCLGPIPAEWSARLAQATVVLPEVDWYPEALDLHGNAFGAYIKGQENGIGEVNLSTGSLSVIEVLPSTSGTQWMSYSQPWLVWVQGDDPYNFGTWSIHAWNSSTHEKLDLGTSQLADGTYLQAQLTFPVVGHGYVAWSTPTTETSADLRVYQFGTHREITLDSGRLSSPVIAGTNLVWAKFATDPSQASFRMVDAQSFRPVAVPTALSEPQPIVFLAGSQDYLAWTSWIYGTSNGLPTVTSTLTVDRLSDGSVSKYLLPANDSSQHGFQFPILAGHFMVWNSGSTNTVLDLQTGAGFDVALPSGADGNFKEIVLARISGGGKSGSTASTTVGTVRLAPDISITSCTR